MQKNPKILISSDFRASSKVGGRCVVAREGIEPPAHGFSVRLHGALNGVYFDPVSSTKINAYPLLSSGLWVILVLNRIDRF
jgi:hypothetical protein